jgi:spore coat polysaccharide biosynthesis predicted glycosyltransferase SpsG
MTKKRAFIYLNADDKIGSGHFWRSINIANELNKYNIQTSFIYSSLSSVLIEILKQSNYASYEESYIEPDCFIRLISRENVQDSSLLIIDSDNPKFYAKEFQLAIIHSQIKLMIITVNPDFHYYAHILLNQNIIACFQKYSTEDYTHKLFGPEYFIFNKHFRTLGLQPLKPLGKKIFIAFGSADTCHYTLQLLDEILKTKNLDGFNFYVVVGALNKDYQKIKELCELRSERVHLYFNIADVSPVMLQCNMAICAPGLMFWELALMGVRSVLFSGSPREKVIASFLHNNEYAFTFHHYDEVLDATKFNLFEQILLHFDDIHLNNFSLLREKLNVNGVVKIGSEINYLLSE